MMYQNVPLPTVVAKFGGGYVGAQQEPQGQALGEEAVRRFGLKAGDKVIVIGPFDQQPERYVREGGTADALEAAGIKVTRIPSPTEWAADPNLAIPVITAALTNNPDVKVIVYPGGQLLGNAATYMQAAGKKPGEVINIGFDTSPQIVAGFKDGWVQLTADQQPFLQGYLPILSLCQQVVLRSRADQRRHRRRLRDARQLRGRRRSRHGRAALAQPAPPGARRAAQHAGTGSWLSTSSNCKNITKSFGTVYALGGVSLHVDPGEVVGLLGDNGAGKSTLIKILAGVIKPTRGEILIRGKPVSNWSPARSRDAGIETVFQDRALAVQQSIVRNIFMGRELAGRFGWLNVRKQVERGRTADARDRLHLEGVLAATRSSASSRAASGRAWRSPAPSQAGEPDRARRTDDGAVADRDRQGVPLRAPGARVGPLDPLHRPQHPPRL